MDLSKIVEATATGDITTDTAYLRAVILLPGSAASSVVVRAGGSGGTTVLTLAADPALSTANVSSGPLFDAMCPGGIHVTLTGADAAVTVVYA